MPEHYRRADQPASLFLVAAGARTAEACHEGGEKVLKAFCEFRVEGEPALRQRFRRKLIDVGHHLLLKLIHHRERKRSVNAVSKAAVSLSSDSGY